MTAPVRSSIRHRGLRVAFLVAVCVSVLVSVGVFVLDAGATSPDPVSFEDTTDVGLADEDRLAIEESDATVPRVQIFHSQYQYVVGYWGVESALDALDQPAHTQQFGYPVAVYVEAFDGGVGVADDGLLVTDASPDWTDATAAVYVVDSAARTPNGETAVPFTDRETAEAFVADHGGTVVSWAALQDHSFDVAGPTAVRERVDDQRASANERVGRASAHRDRRMSVTVGENASTLQRAVERAPPETTVVVPPGTYEEHVTIDRPLTVRGPNATLRGNETGTVLTVESDDVAVVGLTIEGVGNRTHAGGEQGDGEWDEHVDVSYGRSDAALTADGVDRTYVADVSITTPASGILLRDASGTVVDGVHVEGPDQWQEGFMSVNAIRSPVVVQGSTFLGNRDGIYLHRSHGTVVRNNTFRDNRFGVHFMYTSDSLVADNVARGQTSAGITIMTTPTRNAVVGNDVRHAEAGVIPGGTRSYVAENVLAHNDRGLTTSASDSLYERNVVYGNDVGVETGTVQPSNRVVENDFVANERHAEAGVGPLRVWTRDGVGNFWEGADIRVRDGTYSPTDPVDARHHRVDSSVTLAESPARAALDAVRDTTPGMRRGAIVDVAPLASPVNEETVDRLAANETGTNQ